ncbi:hypothetical protein MKW98_006935 [Papaver atlanticum]|uniref:SWIM-type domain-containing protein n=1 Tax=Papaver atlanticum TaxID=357466 RepID=A0AAD4STC7_9MAGN|nr:hypothetical protein MKW98_006935 [Papaver atlanticum]
MQSIYTMEKFKEFQKELTGKIYYEIIDVQNEIQDGTQVIRYDDETSEEYATESSNQENVVDQANGLKDDDEEEEEENSKAKKVMKHVMFKVWFQKDGCKVNCSCRRFEFRGILCTHAICVLLRNNVTSLPAEYILRRWRKDVSLAHTKVTLSSDSWQLTPNQKRYKDMCDYFAELADVACQKDGKCNNIMKCIGEQLKVLTEEGSSAATEMITSEVNNVTEVLNPYVVVSQKVPTQQSVASTVQAETMNLSLPQIHAGGNLANNMNMLDLPCISPYGHVGYVAPLYGALQQWDYGRYTLPYGGFQMHGGPQEVNEVSPYTAFGPPLQGTLGRGFSQG